MKKSRVSAGIMSDDLNWESPVKIYLYPYFNRKIPMPFGKRHGDGDFCCKITLKSVIPDLPPA